MGMKVKCTEMLQKTMVCKLMIRGSKTKKIILQIPKVCHLFLTN